MGGNIFSNIRRIEYPDFTGDRAKYEALKHAELQRKLQTQQALMQQEQFAHTKEEWDRAATFRRTLKDLALTDPATGKPNAASMTTLFGVAPELAAPLQKTLTQQYKDKLEADAKAEE